jgi:hypothetical protein
MPISEPYAVKLCGRCPYSAEDIGLNYDPESRHHLCCGCTESEYPNTDASFPSPWKAWVAQEIHPRGGVGYRHKKPARKAA